MGRDGKKSFTAGGLIKGMLQGEEKTETDEEEDEEEDEDDEFCSEEKQLSDTPPTKPVHTKRHFSFSKRHIARSAATSMSKALPFGYTTPKRYFDADSAIISKGELMQRLELLHDKDKEKNKEEKTEEAIRTKPIRRKNRKYCHYYKMAAAAVVVVSGAIVGFAVSRRRRTTLRSI